MMTKQQQLGQQNYSGAIFRRYSAADQRPAESTSIGAGGLGPEDPSHPGRRPAATRPVGLGGGPGVCAANPKSIDPR